jgi:hypothetical protein
VFTLTLLALSLLSVQSSLDLFGAERFVFWRESRHHSVWTYAAGKTIAYAPLSMLYPLCFTAMFHTLFNPMASFMSYYWICLCTSLAGEGLGIFISVAFPDTRQVAGGVAALTMAMFTGCFPLFGDTGGFTGQLGYVSFLRYSAQLLFRTEYLAYVGFVASAGCVRSNAQDSLDNCLVRDPYNKHAFWLPSDDIMDGPAKFKDCQLPWDILKKGDANATSSTVVIGDDDLVEGDDGGHWDDECCSTNLYFKIDNVIMEKAYGYKMYPDYSFAKLLSFALVFRILAVVVLNFKDRVRRR